VADSSSPPLLETVGVVKHFPLAASAGDLLHRRPLRSIHAVDGVSLAVRPAETLAVIGESGSGKTTFGWLVARLHEPTGGAIRFRGEDVTHLTGSALRAWRRNVQIVFQDPVGSLDPRLRVWQIVGEPLRAQLSLKRGAVRDRVSELLPQVGLPPDCLDQYPHEFSGGGRQRLSLARALSINPSLVVLDEPTSALDVAVQAQVLNRLVQLQRERGLSYLLITHNVATVRYAADRVAVLYVGQLIELGPVRDVLGHPVHPYTKALLAAVPVPDPKRRRARYRISGEVPTLINPKPGCRFAPRCPFVIDRCRAEDPQLRSIPEFPGRLVACHRAEEVGSIAPETLIGAGPTVPVRAVGS
jgi:oligopeptide/dipeptide ABC transporter ATP-binding protein